MIPSVPAGTRPSRRGFLASVLGLVLLPQGRATASALPALRAWCGAPVRRNFGPHPTPRPGITGAKVWTAEQLADMPDLIPLFDKVRQMPEIVDGIRCHCNCTDPPTFYSLLSCYEGEAMSRFCEICQGQASLAWRLHQAGESLDGIREAIDARFGDS